MPRWRKVEQLLEGSSHPLLSRVLAPAHVLINMKQLNICWKSGFWSLFQVLMKIQFLRVSPKFWWWMSESKSGDISLISRAKTRPQNKFNISFCENVMKIQISVNAQFSSERNVSKIRKSVKMCKTWGAPWWWPWKL